MIPGDLGQGGLDLLLSYYFLGIYYVLGVLHGLSNLNFTSTLFYRPICQKEELEQTDARHWAGRREGRLWPLYRCRRRLRDTQVLPKAWELELELETRPFFSAVPTLTLLPSGGSLWASVSHL